MPVPGPEPGHAGFGPHPLNPFESDDHPDSDLPSPQQLHKEPDHDATNPADTTSELQMQSQSQPTPEEESQAPPAPQAENTMKSKKEHSQSEHELKLKLTKKINSHPTLTPLRKKTYLLLLSVPAGQWTTYAALAKHLGSSARAVGTAMRCNPFAPGVPCHRVLSADRGLGGYMGSRPEKLNGKGPQGNLGKKRRILEEEGVRFDERGRALGRVFVEFTL
ncbi:6-O-methylguanine DNA methyltransferase [Aspergillus stella-maris]|uniref:6-O-methylguanine DNA methyltransferase n=1 Tax=Aspergillus stella-maris TaxID=1810926 RepID=UPI003CCCC057